MFLWVRPLSLARPFASGSGRRRAVPGPGRSPGSARSPWRAGGIVPRRPAAFRRLHRSTVDDRPRRRHTTASLRPRQGAKRIRPPFRGPVIPPDVKTVPDRGRRRMTGRNEPPPTSRRQHGPDRIEHPSRVRRPGSTRPAPYRDQRGNQRPFRVRQIVLPIIMRTAMLRSGGLELWSSVGSSDTDHGGCLTPEGPGATANSTQLGETARTGKGASAPKRVIIIIIHIDDRPST